MSAIVTVTEEDVLKVLRALLLDILPDGTEVVKSQTNRVSAPVSANYVLMTPLLRRPLSTNRDEYRDAALTGSIAGDVLTVTAVEFGEVVVGAPVYGAAERTKVAEILTGTGGVGTYRVTVPQTLASGPLFAGVAALLQPAQFDIQIDIHGPMSADNAQIVATVMRDTYACEAFAATPIQAAPLYATDPRQMPFVNEHQQVEDRWTVDVALQLNAVVILPQQFAGEVLIPLAPIP